MKKIKIGIINSSSFGKVFPHHLEKLKSVGEVVFFDVDQYIDGKELAELTKGCNIIIASVTPFFDKKFFDNKDELLLLTRHGIGYNNVDLDSAKEHDTIVSIVPALIEKNAVAENNVTNLLALMRMTVQASNTVRNDRWEDRAKFVGRSIFNKVVGVIGVGNTGSGVVEILRNGFKCEVIAYDPYKSQLYIENLGAKKVDLEYLLKNSDVICLCANLTEENYHMIGKKEIDMMKDCVYISNTARGALIDEESMVKALESGKVAGLATDVLEVEPGRSIHPYLRFDNVIMTPHTSAYNKECLEEMGNKCVRDIFDIIDAKLPERSVQAESSILKK